MIVNHVCLECGFVGEVKTENRKITCPDCVTQNDFWLEGETPPENHRFGVREMNNKPHCYENMDWVLKYPEDQVPNKAICQCEHLNSCWRITWNKAEAERNNSLEMEQPDFCR